jgi:hypothetical protein
LKYVIIIKARSFKPSGMCKKRGKIMKSREEYQRIQETDLLSDSELEDLKKEDAYDEIYEIASNILVNGCYELDEDSELDIKSLDSNTLFELVKAFEKMSTWKSKLKTLGLTIDVHYYVLDGYNELLDDEEIPYRVFGLGAVRSERNFGYSIQIPKLPDIVGITGMSEFWNSVSHFDTVDVSNMSKSVYSITGLQEMLEYMIDDKRHLLLDKDQKSLRIKCQTDDLMQMVQNYMLIDFEAVNDLIDLDKHYEVPVIPFGKVISNFFEYKKLMEVSDYISAFGDNLSDVEKASLMSDDILQYSSANTYLNIGEYFQCVDITEPDEYGASCNQSQIKYLKLREEPDVYFTSDNKTRRAELDNTATGCEEIIHSTLSNIVRICKENKLISAINGKLEHISCGFGEVYLDNDSTIKLLKAEMEKLFSAVRNSDSSDDPYDGVDYEWEKENHYDDWEDTSLHDFRGKTWHHDVADEIDSLDEDDEWLGNDEEESYCNNDYSCNYNKEYYDEDDDLAYLY